MEEKSDTIDRELPSIAEAIVSKDGYSIVVQWVRDRAFRFSSLIENPLFGLTAHPFDSATNKVLALVGRMEIRDWIDTIYASDKIQHLGLLAYAACGKDAGLTPLSIIEEVSRSSRYSLEEFNTLIFEGIPPDFKLLAQKWKKILLDAKEIINMLPPQHAGKCVLDSNGDLLKFKSINNINSLNFHEGHIRGILPEIKKFENKISDDEKGIKL